MEGVYYLNLDPTVGRIVGRSSPEKRDKMHKGSLQKKKTEYIGVFPKPGLGVGGGEYPPTNIFPFFS